jgi:hypothetical protein
VVVAPDRLSQARPSTRDSRSPHAPRPRPVDPREAATERRHRMCRPGPSPTCRRERRDPPSERARRARRRPARSPKPRVAPCWCWRAIAAERAGGRSPGSPYPARAAEERGGARHGESETNMRYRAKCSTTKIW